MAIQKVTIPYVSKDVENLLMWKDPKKSGVVLAACTAVFLFFTFTTMPLVTIVLYLVGFLVAGCTLWARFGKTVGKPMPELPHTLKSGVSEEEYRARTDKYRELVNRYISLAYGIITCKDFALNAKIIGGAFFAGKVLHNVPPLVIIYMGVVFAFAAPKTYEMYKEPIDENYADVKKQTLQTAEKVKEEVSKAMSKVPALKNMADKLSQKKID